MKLYGIAGAAIPKAGSDRMVTVTCTSVCVTDGRKHDFEMRDNLKFIFDFTDVEMSINNFVQMVAVLKKTIALQKQNTVDVGIEYRPVSLDFGQDSRNRVLVDMLYVPIFGKRVAGIGRLTKDDVKNRRQENIELVLKNRAAVLLGNPPLLEQLKNACNDLSELLDKCVLVWGSYRLYGKVNPKQTKLDRELIALRPASEDVDPGTHLRIREMAMDEGWLDAVAVTGNPELFAYTLPEGYFESEEMQRQCPRHSFYYWHPDYWKAYHLGFDQLYAGRYNRHIRLPLDPVKPPFADPCADMVRDQFDIVRGKREADNVRDEPEARRKIAAVAKETAEVLTALMEGANVRKSDWSGDKKRNILEPDSILKQKKLRGGWERAQKA